jgi:hypothetical protein
MLPEPALPKVRLFKIFAGQILYVGDIVDGNQLDLPNDLGSGGGIRAAQRNFANVRIFQRADVALPNVQNGQQVIGNLKLGIDRVIGLIKVAKSGHFGRKVCLKRPSLEQVHLGLRSFLNHIQVRRTLISGYREIIHGDGLGQDLFSEGWSEPAAHGQVLAHDAVNIIAPRRDGQLAPS